MSDLAQAYIDIEPDIRDLLRTIRIAALLARDPPGEDDDDDLVAHAICQAEEEAVALKEKYYALHEGRA